MKWTAHIVGGPKRVNHAAVLVGNKIYSLGGYWSSEDYDDWAQIPVHVLDTSTYRWKAVEYDKSGDVPFQKYGHTAVAYKGKIYMWGGRNNAVASDSLSCFDTKTLTWTSPKVTGEAPSAKDGHSACVIKNKMYVFGGFEYISEQYSQDVHCINLDTFEWRCVYTKGTPPCHRDFQTSVAYDDRMYIFGGRGDLNSPYSSSEEVYCPQVFYLDTTTDTWVNVNAGGTWPEGRRSHSAWIYNDFMYIFGGLNETIKTHFNDVYRYSIKGNYWEFVNVHGIRPSRRRRQACILYENKVYLFGGTSPCLHIKYKLNIAEERLRDNSDLHILDLEPTLRTLCMLCVLEHKLDQTYLPRSVLMDLRAMTLPNKITPISAGKS